MSTKLVKNSLFLYFRMLILLGIGFFTSRKILEALGIVDLGIYNVVASFVVMFDFVSSGLTNSTQRFLSVGLGKNNRVITNQYFSQSLVLHVLCGFFISIVLEFVGPWFVYCKLNVPLDRQHAALVIFHLSVCILFLKFIRVCFESNVIAREHMSAYAYLCVFEGISKLIVCFVVVENDSLDKLILYVLMLLFLDVCVTMFYVGYCIFLFPESRFHLYKDRLVYKQLLSFVGVNSFGVVSWALGKQGIDVVMSMFLGPAVNGAKALATQLDRIVSQFGSNVDVAIRPQITKSAAMNDYDGMISLAMKSTRYIFFVMFIIGIPFILKSKLILEMWLGNVPEYTDVFVKILVFEEIFNVMGKPFNNVSMAIGKIKTVQIYGRLITLSILPLSYVILKNYPNPVLPIILLVLTTLMYSLFIVFNMNQYLHFGMKNFFCQTLKPVILTLIVSIPIDGLYCYLVNFQNKWLSLFVDVPTLGLLTVVIVFFCGLERQERLFILSILKSKGR